MVEGLWVVQYVGTQGSDGGVVVLTQGKVLGGDNGFTYIGTYQASDAGVKARVRIHQFNPQVPNILSLPGDYTLEIDLRWEGKNVLQGQGVVADEHSLGMAIKLTKHAALP